MTCEFTQYVALLLVYQWKFPEMGGGGKPWMLDCVVSRSESTACSRRLAVFAQAQNLHGTHWQVMKSPPVCDLASGVIGAQALGCLAAARGPDPAQACRHLRQPPRQTLQGRCGGFWFRVPSRPLLSPPLPSAYASFCCPGGHQEIADRNNICVVNYLICTPCIRTLFFNFSALPHFSALC